MAPSPRTAEERIAHARRRLETEPNVWIASASAEGVPHLVPLSLAWDGRSILVATPAHTVTARNAAVSGRVRAALQDADDVVLLDTVVEVMPFAEVDDATAQGYVARVGWDPRDEAGEWSLLRLTPTRVQAWNGIHEDEGRTVMRRGAWVA